MTDREKTSTSKSGKEKIQRSIRQLDNIETLLHGLPKYIRKSKKATLQRLENQVEKMANELVKILRELE